MADRPDGPARDAAPAAAACCPHCGEDIESARALRDHLQRRHRHRVDPAAWAEREAYYKSKGWRGYRKG